MGEYADDATDRDLGAYWASLDDFDDLESGNGDTWYGSFRRPRRVHRPTSQEIFEGFAGSFEDLPSEVDKPIDYSQF